MHRCLKNRMTQRGKLRFYASAFLSVRLSLWEAIGGNSCAYVPYLQYESASSRVSELSVEELSRRYFSTDFAVKAEGVRCTLPSGKAADASVEIPSNIPILQGTPVTFVGMTAEGKSCSEIRYCLDLKAIRAPGCAYTLFDLFMLLAAPKPADFLSALASCTRDHIKFYNAWFHLLLKSAESFWREAYADRKNYNPQEVPLRFRNRVIALIGFLCDNENRYKSRLSWKKVTEYFGSSLPPAGSKSQWIYCVPIGEKLLWPLQKINPKYSLTEGTYWPILPSFKGREDIFDFPENFSFFFDLDQALQQESFSPKDVWSVYKKGASHVERCLANWHRLNKEERYQSLLNWHEFDNKTSGLVYAFLSQDEYERQQKFQLTGKEAQKGQGKKQFRITPRVYGVPSRLFEEVYRVPARGPLGHVGYILGLRQEANEDKDGRG